jgi:hypothetical protein
MAAKTIRELIEESSKRRVTPEEFAAAREYERSLIPDDIEIPCEGDIYTSRIKVAVTAMIQYQAAGTAGNECHIPPGSKVSVMELFEEKPLVIACRPVDDGAIEVAVVPPGDRQSKNYSGFYLLIGTLAFLDAFEKE